MVKNYLDISINQLHDILKRFHKKFYKRKTTRDCQLKINPNKLPLIQELEIDSVYLDRCAYVGININKWIVKKHIIIKYKINQINKSNNRDNLNDNKYKENTYNSIISLSVLYDDYKDIVCFELPKLV